jgi:hypothetical protein
MKTCRLCKHGYIFYSPDHKPPCVNCYLTFGKYSEKHDPDDTCPDWEFYEHDDEDDYEDDCYD